MWCKTYKKLEQNTQKIVMKSFKIFVLLLMLILCAALANEYYVQKPANIELKNEQSDEVSESVAIATETKHYPAPATSRHINDNASALVKERYYNYDEGETELRFMPLNNQKGILVIKNRTCSAPFNYVFTEHTEYFESQPDNYTCLTSKLDSVRFYYDLKHKTIEANIDGKTLIFTTYKLRGIDDKKFMSGDYLVDGSWVKYKRGNFERVTFFEDILVKVDTKGTLSIESFDFLEEFAHEEAPLQNIKGYNSAYVSSAKLVQTKYDNEDRLNYVFEESLFFNGYRKGYSCAINYIVIIENADIVALAILKKGTGKTYLLKLKRKV